MSEVAQWPVGASIFSRLRIGLKALEILKYAPDHPIQGPLFTWCLDSGTHQRLVAQMRATDEGRRLLAERPTLQGPDLDLVALGQLPAGSLGYEFARYFTDNHIQPFITSFKIDSDDAYLGKRYRETHDLVHVLTGYPIHMLGEVELQAFVLGNLGIPSAAMIVLYSVVLRLRLCGLKELGAFFARLRAAWQRGRDSRMLMSVEFEKMWHRPLREVTAEIIAPSPQVPAVTHGVFLPPKPA